MIAARLAPLRPSPRLRLHALAVLAATLLACRHSADADTVPPDEPSGSTPAIAEPPAADPTIDAARMFDDLEYLSSDALRGRYTFSEELGVAADYLIEQYRALGLRPVGEDHRVAFQAEDRFNPTISDDVVVWVEHTKDGSRQVAGDRLVTLANGGGKPAYADAVGIGPLATAKANAVRGKVVVAPAPPPDRLVDAVTAFAKHGPAGLVLIGEGDPALLNAAREPLAALELPIAWLSPADAKTWMGIETPKLRVPAGTRMSMSAKHENPKRDSFNVLAVLPGSEHPEEIVMLGAHYDHIGSSDTSMMCRAKDGDTICNGADDNGSGTAMVLGVARAMVKANYRPARTIVFAHFAGEELGLLGSEALADAPPKAAPFAGGKIVAMINLDMVGRLGKDGLAIGGVGSSDAWMPLLEEVGTRELPIVYERAINSRSDHASFYRKKVPVLFFFTGLHDDYHKPADHFDRINREGMASIAQLVADLTRKVADGAAVPYAPPRNDDEGVVSRMPGTDESSVEKRSITPPAPAATERSKPKIE
ncbi:M20/M25/M40 family metallo-hydrolase [Paraliomyxa miuraensis]|nr:M20/M25/M40 family metallo-hydrolase [Paraliomyxa miuraensis]